MDLLAARSRPARTPARRNRIAGAGWWLHLIGAIALVAGLFLPLTALGSALAAPGGDPAALTRLQAGGDTVPSAPAQVAAVGDFQSQLGCADFDPSCQTTQLTEHQGIWTGVFAVPPGQYSWQILAVAPDGSIYAYGQGGLDGPPQQVTISDSDAGLYFRLNTHTNEVEAAPVSALYSVSVDGTSVALNPTGEQLTALVTSQAGGPATAQVFAGGDPLGEPQPVDLQPGPNLLTFSPDGQIVSVEPIAGATLTVERLDAAGNPLPGGCYQLLSGGALVNQACDADTGADGYTTMTFPEGVPSGTAILVEVTAPDGAEPVDDQEIQLAPGELFISLQPEAAAEPTEALTEPTEALVEATAEDGQLIEGQATEAVTEVVTEEAQSEPGDLLVYLTDGTGAAVPGACFELLQDGTVLEERCDREPDDLAEFANNGTTGFFGVPSGTYTLRLSDAPEGVTAEDREVEVIADQTVEEFVTAQAEATEAPEPTATVVPTEAPPTATVAPTQTPVPEPANLTVTLLDQNNQPVGGACFQLIRDGQAVAEACDTAAAESAEFANNGNTGFFDIDPGTYTLRMSAAPEGIATVEDRQVDIAPGSDETVTITVEVATPTVAPTQTPEPTVAPTEALQPTETAVPTEVVEPTATETAAPGNLTVTLVEDTGEPIGGACWELLDGETVVAESCDTPDWESAQFANNGNTGFFDIPAGTYTLRLSSAPEGVSVEEREVEVPTGDENIVPVTAATAEATEAPTEAATATEAPTEAPAVETAAEPGPPANLVVELRDADGEPIGGACFQIAMEGQPPIVSCDADDAFPGNGRTGFFGVPSGTYTLSQTTMPQGTSPIDEREITIEPGENPDLVVTPGEGAGISSVQQEQRDIEVQEPGTVTIDVSALGGGEICVQLDTGGGIGFANPPVACDGAEGDQNPEDGLIGFEGIDPGTYQLSVISGAEGVASQEIEVLADAPTQVTLGEEEPEPTVTVAPTQTPEPTTGTVTITVVDSAGNGVGGACFDITNPSGGPYTFCDEDGDGAIQVPDAVFGTQTIAPNSIPGDYATPEPQQVELSVEQQSAEVQFELEAATGAVEVTSLNEQGEPLPGACIALDGGDPVCQDDATVTFEEVPAGQHTVTQTDVPEGFQPAGQQSVTVAEDETAEVTFETPRQTGTIEALIRDTEGNALPGACVALDEGEPVCDTDGDGSIVFENVPVGQHTLAQTQAPEGYTGITDQQGVGVGAEQPVIVTFENEVATGSIVATVLDENDAAVPGVCVTVDSDATEPQALCEPVEGGAYRFDGLQPGMYTVSVSQVPEEYVAPDAEQVEVTAGGEATIDFELAEAPPQIGSAQLSLLTEDGQAAVGVCVALTNDETGEEFGRFCDGGEGDGDATEGVLLIEGIPVGSYEVGFPNLGPTEQLQVAEGGEPIIIEILAGETIQEEIVVPGLFVLGAIEIRTVDAGSGADVPGACYSISTATPIEVCDGGEGDESTDDGTVLVSGLSAGEYTVTMTAPPEGYTGGGEETATVTGGQTASLSFEVEAEVTTGSLSVLKVDDAGEALPGACFRLQTGEGTIARACDEADGVNDGTMAFSDVPAGTYDLVETRTPRGYQTAAVRSVEIATGGETEVEVVNTPAPGRLNVIKVDAADPSVRLEGACFELRGATTYGPFCDGDDLAEDGRIVFTGIAPGPYTLVETQALAGYDRAPDRELTIRAGVTLQVTVQNQKTPPPPEAGTLVVNKLGPDNEALAGGCFRLYDGDTPVTGEVCDIGDGTNDARIVFENVPAGTWMLRETLAPSPAYQVAADQEITIEDDETTEVDVVNRFKNGRILVKKVTPDGRHPIAGACFELQPDQGEPLCSDANGEILFENLPVGTYTLVETKASYGFRQAEPVEDIRVRPAQTTIVTVENERQPPPNTGSVQVLKFVCPVDTVDEERTSFLGGAAGNAELAQTKGCAPADAGFTLVGQDGSDGPGAFRTGRDGQYQVTVPAEVYRLDETDPDLPGNSAALLRVEVGRLTTVVVINYVAPPAPEPVDIHVTKYTCQAGFNGTTFADFAASCMNSSQLTNNITVRAEGPADLKAVTGDGGQVGRTVFADQPSGTWTIYEERPYNIPTTYQFCGWDPNWPAEFKSVNGAVTAELGEGDQFHCVLFNIPEPVTDSTGVILVRKYVCDVETPPKGYDFDSECRLSDQLSTFELKRFNEETQDYGEGVQQTANPDGILRFVDLRSGSFQLREVGANWCYANSNSVNAKGDVVVQAGQVSLVSIYNCVGTSQPPNTGSGDAAGLLNPEPGSSAPGEPHVAPGIAWPLAAIAAVVFALRPRRVLAPGRDWRLDEDPERDAA